MSETAALVETHPRPQLTRADWLDLSGPWQFTFDDDDHGRDEGWCTRADVFDRTILVPFPPESRASGINDPGPHSVVWYRKTVSLPQSSGRRWLLHCNAVDYRAEVWVNGHHVVAHEGGSAPFRADITPALRAEGEQVIVIRAEDDPTDLAQPRGKQYWETAPRGIWYKRTTGIWQPVWLEPVAADHISEIRWTPDLPSNTLRYRIQLSRSPASPLVLRVRLTIHGHELADDAFRVDAVTIERAVVIDPGRLTTGQQQLYWTPEHPNLIEAELELRAGDQVLDRVGSYTGFRSVGTERGKFLLNSRPYYLRFALEQGYWPESHLAAPSPAALRREVELIKELGFNGVRIHQKAEDPRFLAWCDRLGVLIWGEIGNAYLFTVEAIERLTREWIELVRRDYNHPCIVAWVPLNESWGVPHLLEQTEQRAFSAGLYQLTHALDSTRPVIGNDGWEQVAADICGIHDYAFDGETLRHRYGSWEAILQIVSGMGPAGRVIALPGFELDDKPVMITEFGGISYAPAQGQAWYGYGTVTTVDDYLAKYRELVTAIRDCPDIAGFCYTQLTDTEQETNGLLTEDRQPKLDLATIREITKS